MSRAGRGREGGIGDSVTVRGRADSFHYRYRYPGTGKAGCGLSCKEERCMPLHETRRREGYGDSGKTDFDGVWCAYT